MRKYQSGGPVEGQKQDPALVTKAPKIKKEFGLIDWTKPADYIERFVRAMQPWPTAYTFLHRPGKEPMRVIVNRVDENCDCRMRCRSECTIRATRSADAPRRLADPDGRARSRVNDYCVEILELQPAGKKKMTAEEFLRGYPIVEGMRFGPEVLS